MVSVDYQPTSRLLSTGDLCRFIAAIIPAVIIGYSALFDPLLNMNARQGEFFGGVEIGGVQKDTTLTKIFFPAVFLVTVACFVLTRPRLTKRELTFGVFCAGFLGWAILSTLWATTPSLTFNQAVYQTILFSSLFMASVISGDVERIMQFVLLMFAMVVTANLAAVVLLPASPIGHSGIYEFKNTLGGAGGFAFLVGLFHIFFGSVFWRSVGLFTALGAITVTLASDSKTALALVVFAPTAAVGFWFMRQILRAGPLFTFALMLLLVGSGALTLVLLLSMSTTDVLNAVYGDATFTGRTGIWEFVWTYVHQSPLIGNGYRGFWFPVEVSPKFKSEVEFIRTIGSAHNGYLEILLDLGIVGLLLLFAIILLAISMAGQFIGDRLALSLLFLSVMFFAMIRNFMESVILWSSFFDNTLFLLVIILAARAKSNLANGEVR